MPGDAKVKKDLSKNIKRLIKEKGMPQKQAIAVAYEEKRKAAGKKK